MLKLKDLIKEEKCDCGCGGCETKLNESVDLPQGAELGKIFTGGGFAFKKEFDEGTCGYGVDGKLGKEPAGAHLIDKDDLEEIDDHEGSMAKSQLERSMKYSKMIYKIINNVGDGGEVKFPAWVQSKLTKSMDYLQSVYNYLDGKDGLEDKFQEVEDEDNEYLKNKALSERKVDIYFRDELKNKPISRRAYSEVNGQMRHLEFGVKDLKKSIKKQNDALTIDNIQYIVMKAFEMKRALEKN